MEGGWTRGRNESGCSSATTCEQHLPGTVCWHSIRARNEAEELPAPRIKPRGITSPDLDAYFDFLHFRRLDSKHLHVGGEYNNNDDDDDDTRLDEGISLGTRESEARVPPVCLPSAFTTTTTTTTCRGGHSSKYQTLSTVLFVRFRKLASSTFPRQIPLSEMTPEVDKRRSMWSGVFKSTFFLVFLIVSLSRPTSATMDITAFEYQRKFHKPLDLGECSQREVTVDMGNNTFHTEEQRCTLQQRGVVTHLPRELNDSRNVLITSANAIVSYLGLCGGEAASFLGILNSGDCVAIEIASQLTFSNKTMIRAFVGYYRKSLDILEGSKGPLDGMDNYYKDKFYLKNRSYGTLEIIFVQFRFDTVLAAEAAKKIVLDTPMMSAYMREVDRLIGSPKNIVVISLSTATQETYELKQFKREEWERGIRYVEILELTIQKTRHLITTNVIVPHLQYQLHPFVDSGDFRLTQPVLWEKTSMLEVQLRQAINLVKKTARRCRKNKSKTCDRVRVLKKTLLETQVEIHTGRSNWVKLTVEEKNRFATRYTAKINSYSNVAKSLAKNVREMKKREKLERLDKKKKKNNEVPLEHRIRHAKSKARLRNG